MKRQNNKILLLLIVVLIFITGCANLKKEENYITINPTEDYEKMVKEDKVKYPLKLKFNYSLPDNSPLYKEEEYYTFYCSGSCAVYRVEKTKEGKFELLEGRLKGKTVNEAYKLNNDYVGLFHFNGKEGITEIEVTEYRELRKVLIAVSNNSMWSQLANKYK